MVFMLSRSCSWNVKLWAIICDSSSDALPQYQHLRLPVPEMELKQFSPPMYMLGWDYRKWMSGVFDSLHTVQIYMEIVPYNLELF